MFAFAAAGAQSAVVSTGSEGFTVGEAFTETMDSSASGSLTCGVRQSELKVVSVQIYDGGISVKCYPNPVADRLTVENPSGEKLYYNVVTMAGQQVGGGDLGGEIDVSGWESGTYFVRFYRSHNIQQSFTLIKK